MAPIVLAHSVLGRIYINDASSADRFLESLLTCSTANLGCHAHVAGKRDATLIKLQPSSPPAEPANEDSGNSTESPSLNFCSFTESDPDQKPVHLPSDPHPSHLKDLSSESLQPRVLEEVGGLRCSLRRRLEVVPDLKSTCPLPEEAVDLRRSIALSGGQASHCEGYDTPKEASRQTAEGAGYDTPKEASNVNFAVSAATDDVTPQWAKDLMEQMNFDLSKIMQPAQEVVERSSDAAKHMAGEDATAEFFRSLLRENPSSRAAKQYFAKKGSL